MATAATTLAESDTRAPHPDTSAPRSCKRKSRRKSRAPTAPCAVRVGKRRRERQAFEDTEADTGAADCGPGAAGNKTRNTSSMSQRTCGHASFISILHDILQKESGPLVGWADQGQSVVIKCPEQVAKKYCDQQKFACFVRQMNSYGYEHIVESPSVLSHTELFFFLCCVAPNISRPLLAPASASATKLNHPYTHPSLRPPGHNT